MKMLVVEMVVAVVKMVVVAVMETVVVAVVEMVVVRGVAFPFRSQERERKMGSRSRNGNAKRVRVLRNRNAGWVLVPKNGERITTLYKMTKICISIPIYTYELQENAI